MSPLVIILAVIALLVIAALLQSTVFATPTYETTIINKRTQNTVIYTGAFIPIKQLILEITELNQIIVKKHEYDRIRIGDRVTITRYSNGRHILQG